MHQHVRLRPRPVGPPAAPGLQLLQLRDLVPLGHRAARFRAARQRRSRMAGAMSPPITVRAAVEDDCALLLDLIGELARFEKAPGSVVATEADLRRYGFGPERRFEALIAFF